MYIVASIMRGKGCLQPYRRRQFTRRQVYRLNFLSRSVPSAGSLLGVFIFHHHYDKEQIERLFDSRTKRKSMS